MTGAERLLEGLSIVEVSAFVAAPLGGQTLAGLGAEVIRVDNIGGGPDFRRWPLAPNGESLYWAGLNLGKKSVAINLHKPDGRALLVALATRPGADAGILLTNMSGLTWLDHAVLAESRGDQISVRIEGNYDRTIAVDYTVNCAVGLPAITGSGGAAAPVHHVLPAWDIAAGLHASTAILAAERRRARTGCGGELTIALSDVALSAMSRLGMIAEAELGHDRPALGNFLFGAFGKDFVTSDGRRFMLVAVTDRHWQSIVSAVGLDDLIAAISSRTGHTLENTANASLTEKRLPAASRPGRRRGPWPTSHPLWTRCEPAGVRIRRSASWWRRTGAAQRRMNCLRGSTILESAPC